MLPRQMVWDSAHSFSRRHWECGHQYWESDNHGQCWRTCWKKEIQVSEIHRRMISMCGNEESSRCIVYFWLLNFNNDVETAAKSVNATRPETLHTAAHEVLVSGFIMANRLIILNKMQEEIGLARETFQWFWMKIWRWWRYTYSVRLMNSSQHKTKCVKIC